jgi:1-acyl-sn-glycerol-3-phosphate acyltransferase
MRKVRNPGQILRMKLIISTNGQSFSPYNHDQWDSRRRFLRFLLRTFGPTLIAKIGQIDGLENIPKDGPAILMMNHIAFIDPIVVLHVVPRQIVPLAKNEVYDYPIIGIFPKLWGVITVRREEFDRRAVRQVMEVLDSGEIVLVAPEGTRRSQMAQGKEGIAYLGGRSGAPIVPVAIEGTPDFPALRFTSPWRGPGINVRFGQPFRYRRQFSRPKRTQLRLMTDEAMFVLAKMLPESLRGVYRDLSVATEETIEWV